VAVDPILTDFILTQLLATPGNQSCAHCRSVPTLASVKDGIFLCDECSRTFGRVKNLIAESWTEKQLKFMVLGGNKKYTIFEGETDEYRLQLAQKVNPVTPKTTKPIGR